MSDITHTHDPIEIDTPIGADTTTTTTSSAAPMATSEKLDLPSETTPAAGTTDASSKPTPVEGATATTSTEEKVGDKDVKITAAPITSGALGYKAPGLMNQLRFKKHFFWLGDEAVPVAELSSYLRGEKPEIAHPTAAWSSHTGKGLLYFTKTAEIKEKPTGIINLSEATDIAKEGDKDFSLQLHKHKHTFQAKDQEERNGWIVALENEHESAKAAKADIVGGSAYKENLAQLEKPTGAMATTGAAVPATTTNNKTLDPKKSSDVPRRVSSDEDEDKLGKKDKKSKSKSRSVSRNKRQSLFGSLLGKKDETEEKQDTKKIEKEEKKEDKKIEKEEKKEEKKEIKEEKAIEKEEKKEDKAVQKEEKKEEKEEKKEDKAEQKEEKKEEKAAEKEEKKEEKAEQKEGIHPATTEETSKDSKLVSGPRDTTASKDSQKKRGSIFGTFFNKGSPSVEKKEEELAPAVPAKDEPAIVAPTTAVEGETSAPSATPVVAATGPTATETVPIESSAVSPATEKRRSSFFNIGSMKNKKATPVTSPAAEVTNAEPETFSDAPELPATTATTAATTPAAATTEVPKDTTPEKKSGSKFSEMFRRPSKASKDGKKAKDTKDVAKPAPLTEEAEKEAAVKPANVDEPVAATTAAPTTSTKTNGEPSIGDVVPEAVTVGEAPAVSNTPQLQATA